MASPTVKGTISTSLGYSAKCVKSLSQEKFLRSDILMNREASEFSNFLNFMCVIAKVQTLSKDKDTLCCSV